MKFELEHLESYDDTALLDEVRRVAGILNGERLTKTRFVEHAKVHSSTIEKRFGGWRKALKAAGVEYLVDKSNIEKSKDEILISIREVAAKLGKDTVTLRDFEAHSGITGGPVRRLFGTWGKALEEAGFTQSELGKRYSDEECFENLLEVWTHLGRQPQYNEMKLPPSKVGPKAYISRWETWRKALQAFVARANQDNPPVPEHTESTAPESNAEITTTTKDERGPRNIPLGLRYYVLRRDDFRCVTCGASPAITRGVVLHVDHIEPWSKGGATTAENLRTLCESCNLGKGGNKA